VAKAGLATIPTLVLAVLAGAFIAFGAMLYVVVTTDSGLGFGPERLLGGLAFSLGLILVLVGGAELFTGNSLIVFAWADGKITAARLLRNWGLVYFGNFAGATATAFAVRSRYRRSRPSSAVSSAMCWSASRSGYASARGG
jgi:formate/nitrite transporter FocA (FNT family)